MKDMVAELNNRRLGMAVLPTGLPWTWVGEDICANVVQLTTKRRGCTGKQWYLLQFHGP